MKSLWRVVGTVLGAVTLGLVLLVVWLVAVFSGGIDDLLDFDTPRPGDPDVVAAEEAAYDEVSTQTDRVSVVLAAPLGLDAVGRGQLRRPCEVGQHNFKIDDDYDLSCSLTGVRVLSGPATPATKKTVRSLDLALTESGWRRSSPADLESHLAQTTGVWVDVPTMRYHRSVDGRSWELVVGEARGHALFYELGQGSGVRLLDDGRPVDLEQLVARTPPQGYGLVVAVSVEYYRD